MGGKWAVNFVRKPLYLTKLKQAFNFFKFVFATTYSIPWKPEEF